MGVAPPVDKRTRSPSPKSLKSSRPSTPASPIGVRDRAVILLGYASACAPGNHRSRRERHRHQAHPAFSSPFAGPRPIKTRGQLIGVARSDNHLTDPIRALDAWLGIRPAGPGALFTRAMHHGLVTTDRIGPRAVSRLVQARASAAGLDGIPITGHSLPAGHAAAAVRRSHRADRRPDPPPRPRQAPQSLHPPRRSARDQHQP